MGECSRPNAWKKNAWGTNDNEVEEPVVRFVDIMSEDLAQSIDEEEKKQEETFLKDFENVMNSESIDEILLNTSGMTDEEMAIALQRHFDREADLARAVASSSNTGEQTTKNARNMKNVVVTPDRYCPKTAQETDEDSDEDDDELRQIATDMLYAKLDEESASSSRLRTTGSVTKHNPTIAARRNADKTLNDAVNVSTGDLVSDAISSRVYNSLRSFAKTEVKRQMRMKDKEEKATMETSVDANTRLSLFKWINQGVFDTIEGVIATGKESAVLHAAQSSSTHFAVKVYKTTLSEFKNRSEYVKDDFRFKNPRGVLRIWAEREFMNLMRMTKWGLPCPTPVKLKRHLLVMSLIGEDGVAAPRLKNVDWGFFTDVERRNIYEQVESIMCRLYKECQLVHADLSEFNLLLSEGKVYVIDVSQAMDLSHPRNLHFLTRDIENVLSFFSKIETPSLPTPVALFNLITQLEMSEEDDLHVQVEQFSEENRGVHLRRDKARPADFEWEKYELDKKANRGISPARDFN
ncbi:unnamed protein product [Caenorhabditis auriculariae]|uniref:Serine/threonine-protein kinase RIO3 n=1 Tax=Caenorhabditis auriculariae TaxID=2777116 RepID=A0A8S1GYS1_9PELO|nr:unnamed protein product [Caenorhabditis auriculariae]